VIEYPVIGDPQIGMYAGADGSPFRYHHERRTDADWAGKDANGS